MFDKISPYLLRLCAHTFLAAWLARMVLSDLDYRFPRLTELARLGRSRSMRALQVIAGVTLVMMIVTTLLARIGFQMLGAAWVLVAIVGTATWLWHLARSRPEE